MDTWLDLILPLVLVTEDVVLAGGPETWLPMVLGGMGAAGSMMSGGAQGQLGGYGPDGASGAPTRRSVDPTLLGNVLAPIEQATGVMVGRARSPITWGGGHVQPLPRYDGGGMVMPVWNAAVDPALQQPHLMGLPGINTGPGPLSAEYQPYIPPSNEYVSAPNQWGTVEQPAAQLPEVGGGIPQLQGALELLGVHTDPLGNLTYGGHGLFTGAAPGGPGAPGFPPLSPAPRPEEAPDREACENAGGEWTGNECRSVPPPV
jgi:hypothetical protein